MPTCPSLTMDLTTLEYTKSASTGASGPGKPHSDISSAVPQHTQPHSARPMLILQQYKQGVQRQQHR